MVYEDYNMEKEMNEAEHSYILPKHILEMMPNDTHPIFMNND